MIDQACLLLLAIDSFKTTFFFEDVSLPRFISLAEGFRGNICKGIKDESVALDL